tara:strand:+ start:112 stop:387 length:276 start_codon:yes stop_codon:yes gene_type:complete
MNNKDKRKRLMEIIYEIQEMYPHLDRLLVTDMDDPDSIIITSESRIDEIAEEQGLDMEFFDDEFEDDVPSLSDLKKLIGFDDDDGDKGPLQ